MARSDKKLRCAIHSRKSTDEGLDKDFNSLDAQREACAAYVQSQQHEGWTLLPELYDDGGHSGGTLERPALQQLLADVKASKVDVVVVYKIDRPTRSLADFARIVDVLDEAEASFVSVTQAFSTTSSMGRLTLNVLLSFAQFEREGGAERIRDKIAASKAKGMWMGGSVPLGYKAVDRKLAAIPEEAETVREIMRRYLEADSIKALFEELGRDGFVSKRHISKRGNAKGGNPIKRGALKHLLSNPIYVGEVRHKDKASPGLQEAIVDRETCDAVQQNLKDRTSHGSAAGPQRRLASGIETLPVSTAGELLKEISLRISVNENEINGSFEPASELGLADSEGAAEIEAKFRIEFDRQNYGHEARMRLQPSEPNHALRDNRLVELFGRAFAARDELQEMVEEVVQSIKTTKLRHLQRLARLSYLDPAIIRSLLNGTQPKNLSVRSLWWTGDLPIRFADQRSALGFPNS